MKQQRRFSPSRPTGEHLCLRNVGSEPLNGGRCVKQLRQAFVSGPVVTGREGSSAVSSRRRSYKSQSKWSRTSRTENLPGRRNNSLFLFNNQTSLLWSVNSSINMDFNCVFENYYESTCYPTFGISIWDPETVRLAVFL